MTADTAERKLNCIGWPLRDGDGRPLEPQPERIRAGVFFWRARGFGSAFSLQQATESRLVDQVRQERRTGADHEKSVRLVDVWSPFLQQRVADTLLIACEPINLDEALLQRTVNFGLCF